MQAVCLITVRGVASSSAAPVSRFARVPWRSGGPDEPLSLLLLLEMVAMWPGIFTFECHLVIQFKLPLQI